MLLELGRERLLLGSGGVEHGVLLELGGELSGLLSGGVDSLLWRHVSPWTLPGFSGDQGRGEVKIMIFHHDAPDRDREGSLVADGDGGVQGHRVIRV